MKTALIVDDSRVARAVLRKSLLDFGVAVDEVPSAEAAIEYLKVDRPDVIFLDHMMPGMDGFDALGVLKANPSTATIPVLMYTAEEGQFYVSQARALGAVEVLPKNLAPAELERVLRAHHLIGEPRWTLIQGAEATIDEHRVLIDRFRAMLDEQALEMMAEFRRELEHAQAASINGIREMVDQLRPPPRQSSGTLRLAAGASIAALAVVASVGIPRFPGQDAREPAAVTRTASEIDRTGLAPSGPGPGMAAGASATASADAGGLTEAAAMTAAPGRANAAGLIPVGLNAMNVTAPVPAALGTSFSATEPYGFNTVPLNDDRAREYALLIAELKRDGFQGTITLDIYEGRHCINYSADGSGQLAPPEQSAVTCDYIGTLASRTGAAQQSPMFASMVAAATRDGLIRIETVLHGTADPIIDYPVLDYSVTAADWNAIADINHRVSLQVVGTTMAQPAEQVSQLTH